MMNSSKIPEKKVSLDIGLNNYDHAYALEQRVVAAESLSFAFHLLEHVKSRVEALLPPVERSKILSHLYGDLSKVTEHTRRLMYLSMAHMLVFFDVSDENGKSKLSNGVARTTPEEFGVARLQKSAFKNPCPENFIVAEIVFSPWKSVNTRPTQSSEYMNRILFRMRRIWSKIKRNGNDGKTYPHECMLNVWNACVEEVSIHILEGFASVEQLGSQARAQMIHDTNDYYKGVVNIAPVSERGLRLHSKILSYLKAFFIDRKEDMEDWIKMNSKDYDQRLLAKLERSL